MYYGQKKREIGKNLRTKETKIQNLSKTDLKERKLIYINKNEF